MKKTTATLLAAALVGCATQEPKPDVVQLVRENEGHPEVQRAIMEKWLAEKAAGEARLRNIAMLGAAAQQAGAAWYQTQRPVYNYYGPSPAATYFYGMQQAHQWRSVNSNLSDINSSLRGIRYGY